jgi:hypothetical protein
MLFSISPLNIIIVSFSLPVSNSRLQGLYNYRLQDCTEQIGDMME